MTGWLFRSATTISPLELHVTEKGPSGWPSPDPREPNWLAGWSPTLLQSRRNTPGKVKRRRKEKKKDEEVLQE